MEGHIQRGGDQGRSCAGKWLKSSEAVVDMLRDEGVQQVKDTVNELIGIGNGGVRSRWVRITDSRRLTVREVLHS